MSPGQLDAEALVKEIIAAERKKEATPVLTAFHDAQSRETVDDEELKELKKWIKTLSCDELVRAMQFAFHTDDSRSDNDVGSSGEEYELVKRMVSTQPPPPTPIHPRAVPFKSASVHGTTDGRNEETRRWRCRFQNPRLFQFIERPNATSMSADSLPQSFYQNRRNVGKKKEWKKSGKLRRQAKRFDILARKFSLPWGDMLTMGTTREQQQSDELLLRSTHLKFSGSMPICCFRYALDKGRSDPGKHDILRMLHIASRGNFLSKGLYKEDTRESRLLPYCSQWFDPTMQWFSLSMYLSSRFEVSLWKAFRQTSSGSARLVGTSDMTREEALIYGASNNTLRKAVAEAVCKAAVDILGEDVSSGFVRDCLLQQLLCQETNVVLPAMLESDLASLCTIPLIESGSSKDKFRQLTLNHLHEILAHHSEQILLTRVNEENAFRGQKQSRRHAKKKNKKKEKTETTTCCYRTRE
uniref:Uncharacterized protein n=1 Tax=Odontella aurita TaxID=265563 RepID=A0A6U6FJ05_9STRA|mmetsp:Transcript_35538/g.106083  ORF Transcript_35538/g.106083 Transcript_35538/m.106083 type:complete len:469 (+) Transcript_35538:372-1778(+)